MWEQVTKMSFKRKQVHVVMDPSQPAKQDGNNITALSYSGGFRGGKGGANAPPFGGE